MLAPDFVRLAATKACVTTITSYQSPGASGVLIFGAKIVKNAHIQLGPDNPGSLFILIHMKTFPGKSLPSWRPGTGTTTLMACGIQDCSLSGLKKNEDCEFVGRLGWSA
jgi:hypothetical protein